MMVFVVVVNMPPFSSTCFTESDVETTSELSCTVLYMRIFANWPTIRAFLFWSLLRTGTGYGPSWNIQYNVQYLWWACWAEYVANDYPYRCRTSNFPNKTLPILGLSRSVSRSNYFSANNSTHFRCASNRSQTNLLWSTQWCYSFLSRGIMKQSLRHIIF